MNESKDNELKVESKIKRVSKEKVTEELKRFI